jgi:hypothetical protein
MFCAVELRLPCGRQIRFTLNGLDKLKVVQHQHLDKVSLVFRPLSGHYRWSGAADRMESVFNLKWRDAGQGRSLCGAGC